MAATVAAHKTIVQDISLASPFRISAPLYWHARFSFFFVFFHFLFRLHGVLRGAREAPLAFEAMIMRLAADSPPMLSIIRRLECISGYLEETLEPLLRFRDHRLSSRDFSHHRSVMEIRCTVRLYLNAIACVSETAIWRYRASRSVRW